MRNHRIALALGSAFLVLVAVELAFWKYRIIEPATITNHASDLFKEHYPTVSAGFTAMRQGRLALWNPYQLCGLPFLAVPYAGLLYPGNIAHLFLAPGIAIDAIEIAHLVFFGLTMWLLVHSLGLARGFAPGLAAGLTVMLSGVIGALINFPTLVQGMCFLPATVLAVEWGIHGRSRHSKPLAAVVLAGVVALQVLNGSTEFMLYNLYAAGLWTAFDLVPRLLRGDRLAAFADGGWLLLGVVLGSALAGVQLLPTLDLVAESDRSGGVNWAAALYQGRVQPAQFLSDSLATTGFAGVGALPFAGILLALGAQRTKNPNPLGDRSRSIWLYAMTLATLTALLAFGGSVYELYFQTTLGSLFRRPNKLLHLYAFGAALLAALALAKLDTWREEGVAGSDLWRRPSWLGTVLLLSIGAVAAKGSNPYLILVAGLLIVFGVVRDARARSVAIGLLVVAQGVDLFVSSHTNRVRPSARVDLLHAEQPLFEQLSNALATGGDGGRVHLSLRFKLNPGLTPKQGTLRSIPVLMDKQPLAAKRHGHFFARAAGQPEANAGGVMLTNQGHWRLLDLASTRFYVLRREEQFEVEMAKRARVHRQSGVRLAAGNHYYQVYERRQAGPAGLGWLPRTYAVARARAMESPGAVLDALVDEGFDPRSEVLVEKPISAPSILQPDFEATARVTKDEIERIEIEVEASAPGYLVLTDSFERGWHARVAGEPVEILRANYLFRALAIPAGSSDIIFEYAPASLRAGAWLSGGSVIVVAFLIALHFRTSRQV